MNWLNKVLPLGVNWRVFVVLTSVWMASTYVYAQNECANRTLQRIADQLVELSATDNLNGEMIVSSVNPDCTISIEKDKNGTIEHIGFKLFDRGIMEKHSTPIYRFLERYMLELLLLEGDMDIYTRLKMDHVKITSEIHLDAPLKKGLQKIISEDTSGCSIYITHNGQENTVSCIKNDKLLIQVVFPVHYELITGLTKMEAEALFYPQLMDYISMEDSIEKAALSEYDLMPYKDSLYCTYEESYMLGDVVSTSYYRKVGDSYEPIFSSQMLAESIYNIFNASHEFCVTAAVTQSLYGIDNKISYEVPVSDFVSYLHSQGCRLYTGIKEKKGRDMQFVVMAVNPDLGYQHLLICTVDNRILERPDKHLMKVKMYCHIPTHNVSSLLGE